MDLTQLVLPTGLTNEQLLKDLEALPYEAYWFGSRVWTHCAPRENADHDLCILLPRTYLHVVHEFKRRYVVPRHFDITLAFPYDDKDFRKSSRRGIPANSAARTFRLQHEYNTKWLGCGCRACLAFEEYVERG